MVAWALPRGGRWRCPWPTSSPGVWLQRSSSCFWGVATPWRKTLLPPRRSPPRGLAYVPKLDLPPLASDEEADAAHGRVQGRVQGQGASRVRIVLASVTTPCSSSRPSSTKTWPDALLKIARGKDANLRIAAVVHLAQQKALPVRVGKEICKLLERNKRDTNFLMTGLTTLGEIRYLGAADTLRTLLKHTDFSVKKAAIAAIGADARRRVCSTTCSSRSRSMQKRSSRRRRPVRPPPNGARAIPGKAPKQAVDTGTSGDGDQQEAERQATEEAARNPR